MSFECDYEDGVMLEDELDFKSLLDGGAKFTLRSNFQEYDEMGDIFPELETGEDGVNFTLENIANPWEKSFSELIPTMTKIDENIYKKIVRPAIDKVEMEGKCRVTIQYSGYWEKETTTFDSSYMRDVPTTFVTGNGDVLPGLEIAVRSMKRGEESQFIIPYQLLYGEMGCPPRIQAKADALFVIHLMNFNPTGDEHATDNVNDADKRKYSTMIDKILEVKASGLDHFRQRSWRKAAYSFHRAINRLEMCQLENEHEQKKQEELLINLYTNAMVCYNKMDKPKQACSAFKDLSRLSNTSRNAKALFHHGKALMALCDYSRSREQLMKAYRLEPNNAEIVEQLRLLDKKHGDHKTLETNLWRKAMGNAEVFDTKQPSVIDEKFKDAIKAYVTEFKENDRESKLALPDGMTPSEIYSIEQLIKDMELKLVTTESDGKRSCYLNKLRK